MKRHLLPLLVALLPMFASAYDAEINGIYYNFSGTNATVTYKNTNYNSYSGSVVIPEAVTYNGQNYSVTSIGEYAFSSCSNLTSITIGSGILTIRNKAFNSTSLKKIIWLTNTPPTGYKNANGTINYVANNQYSGLTNVMVYPFLSSMFEVDGVKYVPISPSERTCDAIDCAYNESAENISISESVTNKGISLTVKQVNPYLCYGNLFVKDVTLCFNGDVGNYSFSNCSNLSEATISNQGDIGTQAFYGCKNLSNATIHNVGSIEGSAFSGCSALLTAELGEEVTSIGSYAFSGCKNLKSIVIPYAVSSIGNNAFQNCSSMTLVKTGNGVKSIPTYAFSGCSSLKNVQIGTGVSTINIYAFNACSSLSTIQIPQNVTSIDDYVFNGCTGLKTVLINDGEANLNLGSNSSNPLFTNCPLDSVYIGRNITYPTASDKGYSPFYRNTSLRSVTITDNETEISQNEFYGCTNLKNVRIGDGVTKFADWAFSGCSSLDYFSFGSSVKTIGKEAFSDCTAMTRLISKATTPPTCGTQALDDINKWNCTLTVPQGYIAAYQQANQWKDFFFIEGATIPATGITLNQTTLSFNAANQTTTLIATITPSDATNKNVTWTSSNTAVATVSSTGVVTSKGDGTAVITATTTDGTNLTATCNVTVTIDDDSIIIFADANVKAICVANWDTNNDGKLSKDEAAAVNDLGSVFRSKTTIKSFDELQYFTGLTKIANYAFSECSSLTSIFIPESVISIGDRAFYCCYNLTSITIPDGVTSIGNFAFSGCSSLTSITIPNGVTNISESAFNGCRSLTSVTIPNNVTNIGNEAFQYCESLTSVTIPNSVTSIGNGAFNCCYNLNFVTIGRGVTQIGHYAFEDCQSLTSVTIPNSVTSIGSGAFCRCISLTSITIPKVIGTYAFVDCLGLTSVTILEEVTRIPKGAFKGCTSLTSVTIPSSVTKIEEEVFEGCNRLANVYCYADIIPNTDFGFFFSYMRSATLHVPTGSVNAYKVSYPWSEFGTIVPLTDEDAIIEVKVDEIEMEAICYDAQGSMIAKPQKGINIIRYSDGTSKKVLVK